MRYLTLAFTVLTAVAQPPAQDARNTVIPNTDTYFTMPVYKTRAEWEVRARHLRKQILSAAGLIPLPDRNPLNPQIFGRIENKDYSIEKVALETLPGYYLGGNLYRPLGRSGKLPAVASPHGHWNYGRLEHTPSGSIPARCINLARQCYVVFCYDMVGYNDTVQTPHVFGGAREQLWSLGPLGLQLWNSMRVVDFLESLPEVDAGRIAATGASGGGTQTFLLAAVDERVKYAAPVNMISSIMQGGSPCENAPGLRVGTFNVEIAALIAPRPLLMVSATGDWTRYTPAQEFPAVQRIYALHERADNVETVQVDAPHNYNQASREAVYRFFGKHILGERDPRVFAEKSIRVEKLQDMLVWHGRTMPAKALTYEQLLAQWVAAAKRQTDATADKAALRERLAYALGAETPVPVDSAADGERIVLGRPGKGDRVPGVWLAGSSAGAALVVHPDGAEAARNTAEVKRLTEARRTVLLIDAFQTGSAVAPRDRSHRHFLTFNLTDDQNRVQDILTAIAFLRSKGPGEIRLVGLGRAAVWCLFAAAISEIPVKFEAGLGGFAGEDSDYIDRFFVPGIQRAGGLVAARRLVP